MKAIFLASDTLLDKPRGAAAPRSLRLHYGAGAALRLVSRLDYRFVVTSSEAALAHSRVTPDSADGMERRLADLLFREQLALDGFYYCPHHPDGALAPYACDCTCRAPMPGLLLQAAHEHDIDLPASWMIGARLHEIEAGNRAGCKTLLIDDGSETEWRLGPRRIPGRIAPDLYSAAVLIVSDEDA